MENNHNKGYENVNNKHFSNIGVKNIFKKIKLPFTNNAKNKYNNIDKYVYSDKEDELNAIIEDSKRDTKSNSFIKKIIQPSIIKSRVALSIVPIMLLGIVIIIMVNSILTKTTESDVENNLQGAALTVLIAYSQNPGDYMIGNDGNLWKGNFNIASSNDMLEEISKASKINISYYTKDKCIISTLGKDKKVPKDIKKTVIDEGCDFFSPNYNVEGVPSYVYGITVFQERSEEVVGMIVVSADKASREASRRKVYTITVLCVCLGVVVMVIMASLMARGLIISIKDGVHSINKVSNGQLEITFKKKHFKRKDELGVMYNSVATLVRELRRMINNSLLQTRRIIQTSENIDHTAQKTKDSIKTVNAAMTIMTETAESQFYTSNKVVENVEILKDMIDNTYDEIQELNNTKEAMQSEGGKVDKVVNELMYINNSLNEVIRIINSQIEMTHNSAKKIRKSAEMISSFADETNLLALNAAIEAVRVGEQGKGFAIVAKDIKELADQSNVVSMNISKEIGELVKDSNKSITSMNEVNAIVGRLSNSITVTEQAVGTINNGIGNVSERVASIEERVKRMEKASKSILRITEELKQIADKNSQCASDTSSVTDYMTELFDEAIELKEVSGKLAESMSVFKL